MVDNDQTTIDTSRLELGDNLIFVESVWIFVLGVINGVLLALVGVLLYQYWFYEPPATTVRQSRTNLLIPVTAETGVNSSAAMVKSQRGDVGASRVFP